MRCETAVAILASEGLALVSVSRQEARELVRAFLEPDPTWFFLCVKNMSRCVKYQKLGQGVNAGFCHSCHSVKMRQKHLGLLESSRGPPHHVQTDTCLVSDHTY